MTDATQRAREKPEVSDTAAAMGTIRVMVPTEVPMEVETKQATTKRTATEKRAGIRDSIR